MYNRYIPQPDGSYRRSAAPFPTEPAPPPRPSPPGEPPHQEPPPKPAPPPSHGSVGGFLKNLLPRHFDTGDLLIVLLLLLIAGDCQEDQNTALLTLVLYLFL